MRIDGPRSVRANATRRTSRAGPAGSSRFKDMVSTDDLGVHEATGAAAPAGIDALLSVQEAPDPAERRRGAVRRGRDLLDTLDVIRHRLLAGTLSTTELHRLTNQVNRHRDAVEDPNLKQLVAEIELRVAVELAKYGI